MEPRAESLLPEQFGPLQGVRILSTGTIVAQPISAALAAEMGAEVIQIERPGIGDVTRGLVFPLNMWTVSRLALCGPRTGATPSIPPWISLHPRVGSCSST